MRHGAFDLQLGPSLAPQRIFCALSTLRARAAADGGSATDTGALGLTGDIGERSEFASLLELAKGENTARGMEDAAMTTRMQGPAALWQGEHKRKGAGLAALGTLIGGVRQAFRNFNDLRRK